MSKKKSPETRAKRVTISLPPDLHQAAVLEAEKTATPLSAALRRLIEKWLAGEVTLED